MAEIVRLNTPAPGGESLLRLPQVEQRVGLRRAAIYKYIRAGSFPRPLEIARNVVAWRSSDIERWIDGLEERVPALRGAATPPAPEPPPPPARRGPGRPRKS